jgi:hypothetical protein
MVSYLGVHVCLYSPEVMECMYIVKTKNLNKEFSN